MNEVKLEWVKLRQLRKNNRITSKEMAKRLGISRAFYCQIENRTRKLSYDMAFRIATIFKIKPDAIFYKELKEFKKHSN